MKDTINFSVEGPNINKLIDKCDSEGIKLKNIKYLSNDKIILTCTVDDFNKIESLIRNKYLLEIYKEKGIRISFKRLKGRKTTIIGIALFILIIVYQSLFITKININGLEDIKEETVINVLEDNGIFPGCRRGAYDLEATEFDIFDRVKGIAWMELHENGGIITVDIVESTKVEYTKEKKPTNIVALKEGFIEKLITLRGENAVEIGQHVNPGDIIISGTVKSKIDESKFYYVNAEGKAYARCIYILKKREKKLEEEYELSGRFIPGVYLKFGDFEFDSSKAFNSFEYSIKNEKNLINLTTPLPIKVTAIGANEAKLKYRSRSLSEIQRSAEIYFLKELRKNTSEESRILNKDLQFHEEENIIEVTGIFEVVEEIGGEEPIIYERIED